MYIDINPAEIGFATTFSRFYIVTTSNVLIRKLPSVQNRQKNDLKGCVFVNSALEIQCHIVKDCFFGYFAYWVKAIEKLC